jgi:hypothetical protein
MLTAIGAGVGCDDDEAIGVGVGDDDVARETGGAAAAGGASQQSSDKIPTI